MGHISPCSLIYLYREHRLKFTVVVYREMPEIQDGFLSYLHIYVAATHINANDDVGSFKVGTCRYFLIYYLILPGVRHLNIDFKHE